MHTQAVGVRTAAGVVVTMLLMLGSLPAHFETIEGTAASASVRETVIETSDGDGHAARAAFAVTDGTRVVGGNVGRGESARGGEDVDSR